ncbi:MAG: metallophosphoesterase [Paludibacteraceae bacterium]|nr:metallophosphoesterase [Paludibacteraceae bacterium]
MKRCFLLFASLVFLGAGALKAERVMVIADPHVIASSLLTAGTAQDEMMSSNRKMLDLSEPAFLALIDTALLHHPDLVLLPGDLTKDGEKVSHELVAQQLGRLRTAGIQVLVIPGNHDISNPSSYSYIGDQKTKVANISDAEFDAIYADFMPSAATARDADSHSYVAEPFPGVTVLAIDGAHANAGTGSLSENTQNWLLAQADQAAEKGHLIIGMCHWQLLEHFDGQSSLESACRLSNADAFRDKLIAHGVHLVLTGHFHVNGTTTWVSESNPNDSIVEITTGSPITYPCPYRWLVVPDDRTGVAVATDDIESLGAISDMNTYSRDWMREHATAMIPNLALRAWGKVDNNWDRVETALGKVGMAWMSPILKAKLPSTDEARIDLVQRHLGKHAVNLYLFHSEANENERPEEGQALADSLYKGMDGMMKEVFGSLEVLGVFSALAREMAEEPLQSLVEDVTQRGKANENLTNDLFPMLRLNKPWVNPSTAVENISETDEAEAAFDMLGRPVRQAAPGQVIIRGKKKVMKH